MNGKEIRLWINKLRDDDPSSFITEICIDPELSIRMIIVMLSHAIYHMMKATHGEIDIRGLINILIDSNMFEDSQSFSMAKGNEHMN